MHPRRLFAGLGLALTLLSAVALPARADNLPWQNASVHSCAALCTSLAMSGRARSLFSFEVQADSTLSGAAWYIMMFNATAVPADGAVTPFKCYAIASGTTQAGGTFAGTGINFPLGLVIAVSTTGCFTLTSSTHAFISGDFQ